MRRHYRDNMNIDYWPSFTDALLSILLVMIFVIIIFVLTQTGLLETLRTQETAMDRLSRQLTEFRSALDVSQASIQTLEERYEIKRAQLDEATLKLDEARVELDRTHFQLALTSETLALQSRQLVAQEASLDDTSQRLVVTQSQLAATSATLLTTQRQLRESREELQTTQSALDRARGELAMATERMRSEEERARALQGDLQASAADIDRLTDMVGEYMARIQLLNEQLSAARLNLDSRDASLRDLNENVEKFSEQIARLQAQLGESQDEISEKRLEMARLLDEIQTRDEQIEELQLFARYKSEFLARLADVFEDVDNIQIIGDRFVFQGEILFDSGSAELRENGKNELQKFVDIYQSLEDRIPRTINLNIQIQGHTDIDPITSGRFTDNWELSTARSLRVMRYLSLMGIPERRLSVAGFSQYHPVVMDDSPAAKAQNRRIEILITHR